MYQNQNNNSQTQLPKALPAIKPQPYRQADSLVYANVLGSMLQERNPIEAIVGDISRMLKVIANLNSTRKLAQARINQLQNQVAKVESEIAAVNPHFTGTRFDRLR